MFFTRKTRHLSIPIHQLANLVLPLSTDVHFHPIRIIRDATPFLLPSPSPCKYTRATGRTGNGRQLYRQAIGHVTTFFESHVQVARGSQEAFVTEGRGQERKFTLMKMPKYLDRGTDGFHKSCLRSDCIYRTDVYTHIRATFLRIGDCECDVVNATGRGALDISLILSSLFLSFSHFSKSYTYTRRGVACARVHIVDSSDGDSKNFLPACNYL